MGRCEKEEERLRKRQACEEVLTGEMMVERTFFIEGGEIFHRRCRFTTVSRFKRSRPTGHHREEEDQDPGLGKLGMIRREKNEEKGRREESDTSSGRI